MAECELCGASLTNLGYSCNYCGQDNCSTHRLPENHDCIALSLVESSGESKARVGVNTNKASADHYSDFVDFLQSFREENLGRGGDVEGIDSEEIQEQLTKTAPEASAEKIEEVAEHITSEIEDPSEKSYSTYEPKYTVGGAIETDSSRSPDIAPDGSIKNDPGGSESDTGISWPFNWSVSGLSFRVKAFANTLVALSGFAIIFYGIWSAVSTWSDLREAELLLGSNPLPQATEFDLIVIFVGAAIVLFATR